MSEEKRIEREQLMKDYAEAQGQMVYLIEFRKSKKAILMKQAEFDHPTAAAQEREAYAHPEYIEVLHGLQAATEKALLCKLKWRAHEIDFETWRTKQANYRAEKSLL